MKKDDVLNPSHGMLVPAKLSKNKLFKAFKGHKVSNININCENYIYNYPLNFSISSASLSVSSFNNGDDRKTQSFQVCDQLRAIPLLQRSRWKWTKDIMEGRGDLGVEKAFSQNELNTSDLGMCFHCIMISMFSK